MSKYTNIILAICLIFLSFLSASSKEHLSDTDKRQLYNQMALLTLDCVSNKDSLSQEKIIELNSVLKTAKKIQKSDSAGIYLKNLLEMSYLQFVKKDYLEAYNRSIKLIDKYASHETNSLGLTHTNTPTWDWFSEWDGNMLKKKKAIFSLSVFLDSSETGEKSFIDCVLKELPMNLDNKVYYRFVTEYRCYGASSQDLVYFLFRALIWRNDEMVNRILAIINTDTDIIRQNLLKLGVGCYALCEDYSALSQTMVPELDKHILKALNLESSHFKGFCIHLYGGLGVSFKEEILPLIKEYFGENSHEYLWVVSQNPFILTTEGITPEEKIDASVSLRDSVQLSVNIIKGISEYNKQYDYKKAIELGKKWQDKIIQEHKVDYYNLLGFAYRIISQFDKSIDCYEKVLDILDDPKCPKSPVLLLLPKKTQILTNLAYSYSNAGIYEKALALLDYEIPMGNENGSDLFNLNIGDQIFHLEDMGRIMSYCDPVRADSLFRFSDDLINKSNYYLIPTNKIWHYISWASVQNKNTSFRRKLISQAERVFFDPKLNNGLFKVEPVVSGGIYFALGRYYYSIFDYNQAAYMYRQSFNTYSLLCNEDRRKTELVLWDCLNRIAIRETEGVQTILEQQLAMQDTLLGPNHYDCHQTVKGLLKLAIAENNHALANRYYPRFKSMDGVFGRERFNYGNQLIDASVLSLMDNTKEAYEIADVIDLSECEPSVGLQALEVKQSLTENLPVRIKTSELLDINNSAKILSARLFTQVSSQDRVEWARQLGKLKSGFIANACTPDQIDNALDFSLFTKGLLFRTNKHIVNLIGRTKPGQASLRQLSTLNDSIAHYVAVNDTTKAQDFRRQYDEKEREMIDKFLTPDIMLSGLQTGKTDVLKNIGNKGLAIDFVKFSKNDSTLYGAFVFGDATPTSFVSMFHEDELIELITDDSGRRTYDGFDGKMSNGKLYNLIWEKLKPYFSTYSDVYFSVDGELGKIGIEYITDSEGRSIGDSIKLHRAFHLADVTGELIPGKDILCMGVANHDSPVVTNGEDIDRGLWCNLNCDKEIADIRNAYKKKKSHKSFLMDDDVNEPFVQTLNNNTSSIIHLSTHGFYYNTDRLHAYARSTNSPDHFLAIRTLQSGYTSLSGLVLRKGNEYRKLPHLPNGYDDIWTSDEIESLSFPKLQLTVLSACQTGLGDTDSEGVWGLQRAFRIAGTQKLICALDYVNDKRTREFMIMLYKNLSKGISIYDSFQIARTHIFKKHRDDPRMWSTFVLIE